MKNLCFFGGIDLNVFCVSQIALCLCYNNHVQFVVAL